LRRELHWGIVSEIFFWKKFQNIALVVHNDGLDFLPKFKNRPFGKE